MSAQQMLQNDPEYLARQLAQQEIQRYQNFQNPQLGLASTSGAVLGRGLANLFGGRGFFEVSDPALRRVADTQRVFNEAMSSFDPSNLINSPAPKSSRFNISPVQSGVSYPHHLAYQPLVFLQLRFR